MIEENSLQDSIKAIARKIDELIATLPNIYVTIRAYDIQIKAHEDRLSETHKRISELEAWRHASIDQNNEEHKNMRNEWREAVDTYTQTLNSVEKTVITLSTSFSALIKVLAWIAGLTTVVGGGIIVALFSHLISIGK